MNFDEYQDAAMRTAKPMKTVQGNLLHATTGLLTEAGEFASEVKRLAFYDKPLTSEMRNHMAEEIGDVLWYCALAAEHLDIALHDIASNNIAKLKQRFPEKFSAVAAEARADKGGLGHRES